MKYRNVLTLLSSFLLLAACTGGDDIYLEPAGDQLAQINATVDAVDWSTAEKVAVDLDEFSFAPSSLTFQANRPYELTLTNKGSLGHTFVAPAFFGAIAVKGLIFADGEVNMPLLESIGLDPGETNTLIFVPLTRGTYPLICDRLFHESFGMEGTITVE